MSSIVEKDKSRESAISDEVARAMADDYIRRFFLDRA